MKSAKIPTQFLARMMPTLPWLYLLSWTFVRQMKRNKTFAMASFPSTSPPFPSFFQRGNTAVPSRNRTTCLERQQPEAQLTFYLCPSLYCANPAHPEVSWWNHFNPKPCLSLFEPSINTGSKKDWFLPWMQANSFSKQVHLELRMLKHCTFLISRVSGTSDALRNKLGILSRL